MLQFYFYLIVFGSLGVFLETDTNVKTYKFILPYLTALTGVFFSVVYCTISLYNSKILFFLIPMIAAIPGFYWYSVIIKNQDEIDFEENSEKIKNKVQLNSTQKRIYNELINNISKLVEVKKDVILRNKINSFIISSATNYDTAVLLCQEYFLATGRDLIYDLSDTRSLKTEIRHDLELFISLDIVYDQYPHEYKKIYWIPQQSFSFL